MRLAMNGACARCLAEQLTQARSALEYFRGRLEVERERVKQREATNTELLMDLTRARADLAAIHHRSGLDALTRDSQRPPPTPIPSAGRSRT